MPKPMSRYSVDYSSFTLPQLEDHVAAIKSVGKEPPAALKRALAAARKAGPARPLPPVDVYELIAAIKDMHSDAGGTCRECGQPHQCRTYAYVDGLLAARFVDGAR